MTAWGQRLCYLQGLAFFELFVNFPRLSTPLKTLCLLTAIVLTQTLGDIWLSRGMKIFGAIADHSWVQWRQLGIYLLTSPWIWLGVITLVTSMFLYLTAVARLDLSFVMPMLASSYLVNALLAQWILAEPVSAQRWLATLIISLGVFCIYWAEYRTKKTVAPPRFKSGNGSKSFWLLFPLGFYLSKVWVGIIILVLADSAGDLLTAQGAKQIGPWRPTSLSALVRWLGQVLSHPLILSGITFQAVAFICFISLLSWADISLIRPATALGYGVSLGGAHFILRERIAGDRWCGIALIGSGVGLMAWLGS